MHFIDMHCDSLGAALVADRQNGDLFHTAATRVDFTRMRQAGQAAQFFAVFLPPAEVFAQIGMAPIPDEDYIQLLRGCLLRNVRDHDDCIAMAYNAGDLCRNERAGKMSAFLTMEDGRAAGGKLENIRRFYDLGFRAIALTWNQPNCFGAPNSSDPALMQTGLTAFGREAVVYMQELGILVDVSHLSDGGFADVARLCKKPFIASHSDCRALCPHPRNLTDEQLRALGQAGGVAGLNYGPEFLDDTPGHKKSTAALIARHARHMANVGGLACVGLGSDFDGIQGDIEISDCTKVDLLADALKREGFSDDELDKIFRGNVLRVIRDAMN